MARNSGNSFNFFSSQLVSRCRWNTIEIRFVFVRASCWFILDCFRLNWLTASTDWAEMVGAATVHPELPQKSACVVEHC